MFDDNNALNQIIEYVRKKSLPYLLLLYGLQVLQLTLLFILLLR